MNTTEINETDLVLMEATANAAGSKDIARLVVCVRDLQSENAALREQLAEAEKRGRLEGLREADQVSHTVGAIRERIKLLESQP